MVDQSYIFIYDNITAYGAPRGVARYFRHISKGLISCYGNQATFYSSQMQNYGNAGHIRALPTGFKGSGILKISKINEYLASRKMKQHPADIYFSPYYGNVHTAAAQVFTIYDMIYELYFPHTKKNLAFIEEKKNCIERAKLLISISESTARDILSCYPNIDPGKIKSIPLGVDDFFFEKLSKKNPEEKPYFLYVGSRNGYKNFKRALLAYGRSGLAKDFNFRVISPDIDDQFNQEELFLLNKHKLGNYVELRLAASEKELRANYAGAFAFIYPSILEGFGLPVLEALATGTIVAASNAASIPEVAGKVATYFDPKSIDSIVGALHHVSSLSELERSVQIARGILHARQFTWTRCQQQTVEAFAGIRSN